MQPIFRGKKNAGQVPKISKNAQTQHQKNNMLEACSQKNANFFTQINCLISTVTLQLSHGARHKEEANHHENQNYSAQEAPAQLLNQEAMRMQVIHIQHQKQYNYTYYTNHVYTYYLKSFAIYKVHMRHINVLNNQIATSRDKKKKRGEGTESFGPQQTSTSTSISLSSEVWASIICLKPPPCDGAKFKWQHGHQCGTTPFSQVTVKLLSSSLEPHQTHHIWCAVCAWHWDFIGKNGASVESRPISPKKILRQPLTVSQGTCKLLNSIGRMVTLGWLNVFRMFFVTTLCLSIVGWFPFEPMVLW